MKEKIMPPLVLAIISAIVCGLLVFANAVTKDKIIQAQEEKASQTLSETFGDAEYTQLDISMDNVDAIYEGGGKTIFEITADGYAKDGIHILVGFENDAVCGIGFLSLGETPGLGTKVQEEKSFTEQFIGVSESGFDFEPLTGATYSSNGMKTAIETAVNAYNTYIKGGDANE
ncbi:MAG: FMN-binding protein [Porcipelethomonas sp.]